MGWFLAALVAARVMAASPAAGVARAIHEHTFDLQECWRVRDLTLIVEDARIYLTDGYLMFGKPVAGRRIAAVFTADVEGGDGEVILLPPDRGERRSLAAFAGAPNLDEHIQSALFLFTDDTAAKLLAQMPDNPANRKVPEMGALLDERWGSVLRNLTNSFEIRLELDVLAGQAAPGGLFAAMLRGRKLGNFDLIYEPHNTEQMVVGQVVARNGRTFFDTWTNFAARSVRMGGRHPSQDLALRDYRIEATLEPGLNLKAVTRVKVTPAAGPVKVLPFDIAPGIEVSAVSIDGRPAVVLQRDSLRANLIRVGENTLFLVVPEQPLEAGRAYEFEFHHEGKVIVDAGDHVFYVQARGNWYPTCGLQFATYDLRFRYPRDLDLVSAGEVVEDKTEGDWRTTRRRTQAAIRIAGFNLGRYLHARVARGGYSVEVCANRALEPALQPKPMDSAVLPVDAWAHSRRPTVPPPIPSAPPPNPTVRLQDLAAQVAGALEFMAARFGPPALPSVTVSPLPMTFGQGFPGLIYLPTLSYLDHPPKLDAQQQLFFGELMQAHEIAHQWWGNIVTTSGYHDNWISEALANYSALLYLEKRKGARALETMLEQYRADLLAKNENGQVVDAAGPIVFGLRLESSQEPRAWRAITYGKGSWLLHMLRRRMGDERFLAMLHELRRRYEWKEISTRDLQALASRFLPPKSEDPKLELFFDQWVYGTGIPALKLSYSLKGKAPSLRVVGTVTQSEVGENFATEVPVEIQLGRGQVVRHWITSGSGPVAFSVPVPRAPAKVAIGDGVLRR